MCKHDPIPTASRFEVVDEHVAVLTLNRPRARNAINGAMARAIEAALDRFEGDDALWVGILCGRGKAFSAGADLKAVARGDFTNFTEKGGFAGIVKRQRTKPLIAAVDGFALAGGCEIVLSCDLVVASARAKFGLPEVKRSLVAAAGGLFRLGRVLPRNVAMELALTGEPLGAERAHALGLVNTLVPVRGANFYPAAGDAGNPVRQAALALAARIAVNAPVAVRESCGVVREGTSAWPEEHAWKMSDAAMATVARSEDFAEGPRAFVEKRAPRWTGKARL